MIVCTICGTECRPHHRGRVKLFCSVACKNKSPGAIARRQKFQAANRLRLNAEQAERRRLHPERRDREADNARRKAHYLANREEVLKRNKEKYWAANPLPETQLPGRNKRGFMTGRPGPRPDITKEIPVNPLWTPDMVEQLIALGGFE